VAFAAVLTQRRDQRRVPAPRVDTPQRDLETDAAQLRLFPLSCREGKEASASSAHLSTASESSSAALLAADFADQLLTARVKSASRDSRLERRARPPVGPTPWLPVEASDS